MNNPILVNFIYIVCAVLFIYGLKELGSAATARRGNIISAVGMFIAVVVTLVAQGIIDYKWIAVGILVGAIIGVLAAIAIPQYASSRTRSLDASVLADLRNSATVQEAYYMDHMSYSSALAPLLATPYDLFISPGVNMSVAASDLFTYTMIAYHTSANKTYTMMGPGGSILP